MRRPPRSTLFPSPTLFRSVVVATRPGGRGSLVGGGEPQEAVLPAVRAPAGADRAADLVRPGTGGPVDRAVLEPGVDRKSTRLNSSHANISYAVFCLKKKKK